MSNDLYKAPESNIDSMTEEDKTFYVVSIQKFTLLFFATMGLYSVYWFYKNWALYKIAYSADVWPIPRGIFSIFFAHRLYGAIDAELKTREIQYQWNPDMLATGYVIITIFSHVMDRLAEAGRFMPMAEYLSFLMIPVVYWLLYKVQLAINVVEGDVKGQYNNRYTGLNIFWIGLGLFLWSGIVLMVLDEVGVDILPV
ncbi:MAG: hypothetical protein MI867_01750 [Pseudomonadales bacterium]|nr:hypothetical protein [Pseudomonadales bacterium]